jgi:enoyl-[acyl-carrier protein] reductase/trans-2-enoyl-CoA reductase (NAD+)
MIHEKIINESGPVTDETRLIRVDAYEMEDRIQSAVSELWDKVNTDNIKTIADIDGYWEDFFKIFGFGIDNVDYDEDVDIHVEIDGLVEV